MTPYNTTNKRIAIGLIDNTKMKGGMAMPDSTVVEATGDIDPLEIDDIIINIKDLPDNLRLRDLVGTTV